MTDQPITTSAPKVSNRMEDMSVLRSTPAAPGQMAEDLRSHADQIIARWETISSEWPSVWAGDEPRDRFPQLLVTLVTAALDGPQWRSEILPTGPSSRVSREQGPFAKGAASSPVARDHYLVLAAVWDYLRDRRYPADIITRAIRHLEGAIELAAPRPIHGDSVLGEAGTDAPTFERVAVDGSRFDTARAD